MQYTKWGPVQPDSHSGQQPCVVVTSTGYWNDVGCYSTRPYVCKMKRRECQNMLFVSLVFPYSIKYFIVVLIGSRHFSDHCSIYRRSYTANSRLVSLEETADQSYYSRTSTTNNNNDNIYRALIQVCSKRY